MNNTIRCAGARENNLKNISLEIPKGKITVFTGASGLGNPPLFLTQSQQKRKDSSTLKTLTLQTNCGPCLISAKKRPFSFRRSVFLQAQ
jgi:excinuclease UvrABC ATPase subunit